MRGFILVAFGLVSLHQVMATERSYSLTTTKNASVMSHAIKAAYPTQQLRRATNVEVYYQRGDYLAIRPPAGAFSWVPMEHVQRTTNPNIGVVLTEGAVSFVGAMDSSKRSSHQQGVKLRQNEKVRIIGVQSVQLLPTGRRERCFQILPPAGEFRFIRREHFQSQIPVSLAKYVVAEAVAAAAESVVGGDSMPDPKPLKELDESEPTTPGLATTSPLKGAKDSLADLQILVTQAVLEPISEWDLDSLRDRAVALIQEGESSLQRGRARLLLEQIDKFRTTQERWLKRAASSPRSKTTATGSTTSNRPTRPAAFESPVSPPAVLSRSDIAIQRSQSPSQTTPPLTPPIPQAASWGSQFAELLQLGPTPAQSHPVVPNHTGWLVEVKVEGNRPRGVASPKFAIVDRNRNIKRLILPVPGLNLYPFRNKRVGVGGNLLQVQGIESPVLVVENIVTLR